MMRLKVDENLCSGHGRCAKFAPNVFALDEAGFNIAVGEVVEVPEGEEENAIKGMKACPERAISGVDG